MYSLIGDDLGDSYYVAGFATQNTSRVTHVANGTSVDLPIYPVKGTQLQVFGGFVSAHSRASQIIAYDANDRVVGTWPG